MEALLCENYDHTREVATFSESVTSLKCSQRTAFQLNPCHGTFCNVCMSQLFKAGDFCNLGYGKVFVRVATSPIGLL